MDMNFSAWFEQAFAESKETNTPIVNEFGQSRSMDAIRESGYMTLAEYLAQLSLGVERDDLWDEGKTFVANWGMEGEFVYGVNLTPSWYVVPLMTKLADVASDNGVLVLELDSGNVFFADKGEGCALTGGNETNGRNDD